MTRIVRNGPKMAQKFAGRGERWGGGRWRRPVTLRGPAPAPYRYPPPRTRLELLYGAIDGDRLRAGGWGGGGGVGPRCDANEPNRWPCLLVFLVTHSNLLHVR